MMSADDQLIRAIEWLRDVRADPSRYRSLVDDALSETSAEPARAILLGVLCRSCLDLGDVAGAIDAGELATATDSPDIPDLARAELWTLYSTSLLAAGQHRRAMEVVDEAAARLSGRDQGMLDIQRGAIHYRSGELEAAVGALDRCLQLLPADRPIDRGRALNNRAVAQLYLGAVAEAEQSFDQAISLFDSAGLGFAHADARHNRAMVFARLGDLPRSLAEFAAAERDIAEMGGTTAARVVARAEIMAMAGLAEDVLDVLPEAIDQLDHDGYHADADEGRLYLAMAQRLLGDPDAVNAAGKVAESFERSARLGWAAIARFEQLLATPVEATGMTDEAEAVCERLDANGMHVFAAAGWLHVARSCFAVGQLSRAVEATARVRSRRRDFASQLAVVEAQAIASVIAGDRRRALAALRRGESMLRLHRLLFAATELRSLIASWGTGLSDLETRVRWDGAPRRLLLATERWRSGALLNAPGSTDEATLHQLLAAYRATNNSGVLLAATERTSVASMRARAAEQELTQWLRAQPTHGVTSPPPEISLDAITEALRGRTLVELVHHGDDLRAIIFDGRSCRTVDLGSHSAAIELSRRALQALGMLAAGFASRAGPMLQSSAARLLAALRETVLGQVTPLLSSLDVVVVPTTELHCVPWPYLAGDGYRMAVCPTIAALTRTPAPDGRGVVCAAGPGLPGATSEVSAVAKVYSEATVLTGATATVDALVGASAGRRLVHLAAHARFASMNPLFSSLLMADGPATAHDLERVSPPPTVIVLSGCSTALAESRRGGDLLGLSTVLLSAGTSAVVVSLVPLPDEAIVATMVELHRCLAAGQSVAEAIASVVTGAQADSSPFGLLSSAALVGLGETRVGVVG